MARTRLFSRLGRILRESYALQSQDSSFRPETTTRRSFELDRRRFLGCTGSGLLAGLVAGCSRDAVSARRFTPAEARIAVVGAGLAGLHCAHRLRQAGIDVTVYEASARSGGRTFTDRKSFGDQVAELGGEFIDSNHVTLHALAHEFDIKLDDRHAEIDADAIEDVWWVAGAAVPETTIVAQFSEVAPLMAELADRAHNDQGTLHQLDKTPLADWLAEHVPPRRYPELHAILTAAYRGEYGLETDQQSTLNLLYLIGSSDPNPFRIFGDSDERFHAHTGSQTFCERLSGALAGRIVLGMKLTAARRAGNAAYVLEFEYEGKPSEVEADHVVFALPFTALREVNLIGSGLPAAKLEMIQQLGYGTNAKVIGAFRERVWRTQRHALGGITSDAAFQQCWDSAPGQPGTQGVLTNFLGGARGIECGAGSPEDWYQQVVLAGVEPVFPGAKAAYVASSALRMHWPSHPFTKGSYACYRPGQWSFWSHEGERVHNLHFCGEHTSAEFQGYMEGAAETGSRAAGEILADLGVTPAPLHQGLLELWRDLPTRDAEGRLLWRERHDLLGKRIQAALEAATKLEPSAAEQSHG